MADLYDLIQGLPKSQSVSRGSFMDKMGGSLSPEELKTILSGPQAGPQALFAPLIASGKIAEMAGESARRGSAAMGAPPLASAALGVGGFLAGDIANLIPGGKGAKGIAAKVPQWVSSKLKKIESQYGKKVADKIVKEYEKAGVPLFSHDLPMDEASKLARAKQLGFYEDAFHGTNKKFVRFRKGLSLDDDIKGVSVARDKDLAKEYGPEVMDLKTRGEYIKDSQLWNQMPGYEDATPKQIASWLKKNDYKGIEYDDFSGYGSRAADPSDIRSTGAAFDPRMSKSDFLMASKVLGAGGAGIAIANQKQSQPRKQY